MKLLKFVAPLALIFLAAGAIFASGLPGVPIDPYLLKLEAKVPERIRISEIQFNQTEYEVEGRIFESNFQDQGTWHIVRNDPQATPAPVRSDRSSVSNNNNNELILENEEEIIDNAGFANVNRQLGQARNTEGQLLNIYRLDLTDNNCGLFGIYGREITREEVVNELTENVLDNNVYRLMARDILAEGNFGRLLLLLRPEINTQLQQFWNNHYINNLEGALEALLKALEDKYVFDIYVRHFIGERINSGRRGDSYPMLGYSALLAIAVMNGRAIHIYQMGVDGILQKQPLEAELAEDLPVISLLHTTADPNNAPDAHNHFNLLQPTEAEHAIAQEPPQVSVESAFLKLRSLNRVDCPDYLKARWLQSIEDAFFSLLNPDNPSDESIQRALEEILERQIDFQLSRLDVGQLASGAIANPLVNLTSSDEKIQRFLNAWTQSFKDQWNALYDMLAARKEKFRQDFNKASREAKNQIESQFDEFWEEVRYDLIVDNQINTSPINTSNGNTLLHRASYRGWDKIVKLLLAKKWLVDLEDKEGRTAIYEALQVESLNRGHFDCIRVLLRAGANPNQNGLKGSYLLKAAVRKHAATSVRLLIAKGAEVDFVSEEGMTAMLLAGYCGHVHILQILLDEGADPNLAGNNGLVPLHLAAWQGHLRAIQTLLDERANPDIRHQDGHRALHIAIYLNCLDILNALIEQGASVNLEEGDTLTPLRIAVGQENFEAVKRVLDAGANPNPQMRQGAVPEIEDEAVGIIEFSSESVSPLFYAATLGNLPIAEELLLWNADVNAATHLGYTPLFAAVLQGNAEMVKFLLEYGASVNAQGGSTSHMPLLVAVLKNSYEIVEILLNAGASIETQNDELSPIKIVMHQGSKRMKQLFKRFIPTGFKVRTTASKEMGLQIYQIQSGLAKAQEQLQQLKRQVPNEPIVPSTLLVLPPNKLREFHDFLNRNGEGEILNIIINPRDNALTQEELKSYIDRVALLLETFVINIEYPEHVARAFAQAFSREAHSSFHNYHGDGPYMPASYIARRRGAWIWFGLVDYNQLKNPAKTGNDAYRKYQNRLEMQNPNKAVNSSMSTSNNGKNKKRQPYKRKN